MHAANVPVTESNIPVPRHSVSVSTQSDEPVIESSILSVRLTIQPISMSQHCVYCCSPFVVAIVLIAMFVDSGIGMVLSDHAICPVTFGTFV